MCYKCARRAAAVNDRVLSFVVSGCVLCSDVKRGRVAGVAQGRGKDNVGGKLAGMKADGTPDRRLRAYRKTHGGNSGGSMDPNPPPTRPPGAARARPGPFWGPWGP